MTAVPQFLVFDPSLAQQQVAPVPMQQPAMMLGAPMATMASAEDLCQMSPNEQSTSNIAMATAATPTPAEEETVPFGTPSCCHNNWDNVRVKKSIVTLSCRDCHKKWKQTHPIPNLCPDFYSGVCPFGPHCPYLHVHRFKSRSKSPNPPGYVEGTTRDPLFHACAKEVLDRSPPGTTPTQVYEEVINLFAERQQKQREDEANGKVVEPVQQAPQPQPAQMFVQYPANDLTNQQQHVVKIQQAQPAQFLPVQTTTATIVQQPAVSNMPAQNAQQQQGWFGVGLTSPFGWFDRRGLK